MTISISDRAVTPVQKNLAAEPTGLLPFNVWVDDSDSPADIIDALALAPFVTGREPWSRMKSLSRVRADASLMPKGGHLLRSSDSSGSVARLIAGDGWTLRSVRWSNGNAQVSVSAISDALATRILTEATTDVATIPVPSKVSIGFWHRTQRAVRTERAIPRRPWESIRHNYAGAAASAIDRLMTITPAELRGRLLLLHGAPGTGKTTALRSLATEWREWCQVDCVLDPERLFADPSYLMEVVLGQDQHVEDDSEDDDVEPTGKWRMLLLEDCDELIRSEAKSATGQALSRLLNLTDGLLGQGRNVLVAITTNEDLARLHPATVRPGRCLAQIEVGPLSRDEAASWLGTSKGIGYEGATLAQLYALRDGDPAYVAEAPVASGLYL